MEVFSLGEERVEVCISTTLNCIQNACKLENEPWKRPEATSTIELNNTTCFCSLAGAHLILQLVIIWRILAPKYHLKLRLLSKVLVLEY